MLNVHGVVKQKKANNEADFSDQLFKVLGPIFKEKKPIYA